MGKETIAIIGAGAAGCFAAANIPSQPGREVIILEKTGKALQKVKVSGGGRCNVTHDMSDIRALAEHYPRGKHLLKKTLHVFPPSETIAWFKSRGVLLKAEADGRMFPVTDQSRTIIDCIWQEMMRQKVNILYHKSVSALKRLDAGFRLEFSDNTSLYADKVLIAAGGGAKPESFGWVRALGHSVEEPVPSLFTFNLPGHRISGLMGVSVPSASVRIAGTRIITNGPVLITHWGLSGPAVLRASAWGARVLKEMNYDFKILVNWLGETTDEELKRNISVIRETQGKQLVFQKNPFGLPKRLWEYLLGECGADPDCRWGSLPGSVQHKLWEILLRHPFDVKGKTTFKEEFVTCGGVVTREINPVTMESRIVPRLFFAGEILDVDGITGGFNFQHAWSSGYIAALNISRNELNDTV